MIDLGDLKALTLGDPTTLLLGLSILEPNLGGSSRTVGGVSSYYGMSFTTATSFLKSNGLLLKVTSGDKSTGRQFSRFKVIFSGFFISISS